jgi:ATP-dependent NAD(P)H-hydrate dehydratase
MMSRALALIPALTFASHKGQHGRVGVLGGSLEYTGAPYYAGMSALKAGADLSFVLCTSHAAIPIKSYSPELIVYPMLETSDGDDDDVDPARVDRIATQLQSVLSRLHVLVVGPGLGRNPLVEATTLAAMRMAREQGLPMVVDADGLYFVSKHLDSVRGNQLALLTPNVVEFKRLYDAVFPGESPSMPDMQTSASLAELLLNSDKQCHHTRSDASDNDDDTRMGVVLPAGSASGAAVERLAVALGHVTILHKGAIDVISDGRTTVASVTQGSPRRCGGQGDILAGTAGLFAAYAVLQAKANSRTEECESRPDLVAAALGASHLTRTAAAIAFEKHKRCVNIICIRINSAHCRCSRCWISCCLALCGGCASPIVFCGGQYRWID